MSNSDPFELLKSKKWPSIPGSPQNYAKEHRDWIKKLVEEFLSFKDEVESLKVQCSKKDKTIEQLIRDNNEYKLVISKMVEQVDVLTASSSSQSNLVNSLKVEVEKLSPLQSNLEGNIKKVVEDAAKKVTLAEVLKRGLDTKSSDFEVNLALANNRLMREKEKRARNIMIFGLKCDNDKKQDDRQVYELFNALNVSNDQIKRIVRLASKTPSQSARPPPVLVELNSPTIRESALKSTRALKDLRHFDGVQVSPDLSPNERIGLKLERETCVKLNMKLPNDSPFEWRVRGGERTKVDKTTKRVYKARNEVLLSSSAVGVEQPSNANELQRAGDGSSA